jgi:phosphotransferase system HPr (HPr) family protein
MQDAPRESAENAGSADSLNSASAGQSATITILHPLGLHLRTGKDVVQVASRYRATITARNLTRSSPVVDAKSIIQLMQLQARQGHQVQLEADGPDAQAAIEALCGLFEPQPPPQSGPVLS